MACYRVVTKAGIAGVGFMITGHNPSGKLLK